MSLFDTILTQPIFNFLAFIYNFVGDFGVAIIIMTVLVRLALWPLVKKQLHQTKVMRDIQPELQRIQKKARSGSQEERMAASIAMMNLYKEKGVKPFSSFLVLLIQLPILIAIFNVIRTFAHVTVNGAAPTDYIYPFLEDFGRIPDLLSANPHLELFGLIDLTKPASAYLPALIIALAAAAFQFIQSKQAMPSNKNGRGVRAMLKEAAAGKDVDQAELNAAAMSKMMYFMPIMTFFICLPFPGAVVLYYATTSLFAVLQQHFILNRDSKELAAEASEKSRGKEHSYSKCERDAVEAEVVTMKKSELKRQSSASKASGGTTVVRRIKAK